MQKNHLKKKAGGETRVKILCVLFTKNTVKPVEGDHFSDHSKMIVLNRWSPYKALL